MEMVKTASEIQVKIDAAEADLTDKQSRLAAAERKLAAIEAEFDEKSIRAVNYGDGAAERWLIKAKEDIARAEFTIKTLRPAVREISERIISLGADMAEAVRVAIEVEIGLEKAALLADSIQFDGAVNSLRVSQDSLLLRRDRIADLCRQIGGDMRGLDKLDAHIQHNVNAQLFPQRSKNALPEKLHRDQYSQSFSKFLQDILKIGDEPTEAVGNVVKLTGVEQKSAS